MGLDMYLKASRYVSGYEHQKQEERDRFAAVVSAAGLADYVSAESPAAEIAVNIGYWRKVNAVHSWFVRVVQNGVDECQEAHVSREQLKELVNLCHRILRAPSGTKQQELATKLLPPQPGFFFGSTDQDEWYFEGLTSTVKIVDKALGMPETFDFTYRSSW